jgi:GTPase
MSFPTQLPQETAIAVGIATHTHNRRQIAEYLEELALLADTAGADVRHRIIQERDQVHPATFIGRGKAAEIATLVGDEKISMVIFDDDLSPVQLRNLEKIIPCKIIDRSGLILDIFATRASTKESMTQVELAQLQYLLPRLTRQWTHLSKQYGGVGTKGPGETQIETDRRAIRARISHLKEKLLKISREREVQRKGRKGHPRVAMVGYTNAGKSTLLRLLSGADVLVEDRLFATLDTTVRQVDLNASVTILLSDTVGFIRKLPPHLIASFRSTLAEATEADLLLHVVDVSHPAFAEHIAVVEHTLSEINAAGKPTILIFNKIDRLEDRSIIADLAKRYTDSVVISASRGINIAALRNLIVHQLDMETSLETLTLTHSDSRTIAQLHEFTEVVSVKYDDEQVVITFRISAKNTDRLKALLASTKSGTRRNVKTATHRKRK